MNIQLKVTNFLWLVFCLTQTLSAQQGVVSAGRDVISPNGSVAFSAGQVAYATIYGESGNVNPGLQQPFQFEIVSLNDFRRDSFVKLYPNPANQFLYLQYSADKGKIQRHDLIARVYDVKGNLLIKLRLEDTINTFRISGLPESLYIIQIWQFNKLIQSISFSKIN